MINLFQLKTKSSQNKALALCEFVNASIFSAQYYFISSNKKKAEKQKRGTRCLFANISCWHRKMRVILIKIGHCICKALHSENMRAWIFAQKYWKNSFKGNSTSAWAGQPLGFFKDRWIIQNCDPILTRHTTDRYSYETSIIVRSHIKKQNADFQEGISQA